ncbi:hypothetical protein SKDZ_15G2130 [Saccharomyces kudriavzevii ZP591]|uniref:YOR062C-like protein n=1 Tax=Saccharomyces cerevisiae x Saccharomyces kudriavzevii (strain VIN7) TaxID=1095631 RepID=H0H0Z8_SACCK|nr:YOR062C-like protein [Saccharomyces cerevisiae x Saccharomyces kudriavzevii VIN7]CAI4051403.1 hypothetical protein SKDZ_15G2130 [Saccharomyces kudriavzevii ZP591]
MTSLDDTVLTKKNVALLDNATNYIRPAVDYFHFAFDYDNLDVPTTWRLLLKTRKHKLLRLPSCSSENEFDYSIYMARLHHCMWRRWSVYHFKLDGCKINPLSINWNKEIDVTLLYGPDLTGIHERGQSTPKNDGVQNTNEQEKQLRDAVKDESCSSPSLKDDRLFRDGKPSYHQSISFDDTVRRRDIDKRGRFHESCVLINDINQLQDYSIVWDERRHRYRRQPFSDSYDYGHVNSKSNGTPCNTSHDNLIIHQNLHSITEGSYIYIK